MLTCEAKTSPLRLHTYQIPVLYVLSCVALFLMELQVILLALLRAIGDGHAFAMNV